MTGQMDELAITTREIQGPVDLLSWLPSPANALSWVRDGDGFVGWGEAARFTTAGPERFAAAQRWWSEFNQRVRVHDEVGIPGTGPVAFARMAFADFPGDSVLIVPKVLMGRRGDVAWMTTIGEPAPAREPVTAPRGVRYQPATIDDADHRKAVAAAVARIQAGGLSKVVLARDLLAVAAAPLDERYILSGLARGYPTCWVYAVAGLIGATPELLLRREGDTVSAQLLAGTVWPKNGVSDNASLAHEIRQSAKNQAEHRYGVQSLVDALTPFCSSLDVPSSPSVLHLPNVTHLATEFSGKLAGDVSLLDLTARVHPTGAVGGFPAKEAVRVIEELEGMDRGGYAGPVGWVDGRDNGEFGVALRCAQVSGSTARLFAGGGIVADSDPANEAAEAAAKFRAFQSALDV